MNHLNAEFSHAHHRTVLLTLLPASLGFAFLSIDNSYPGKLIGFFSFLSASRSHGLQL